MQLWYQIILCPKLLWLNLCPGSVYFWNIILILVILHQYLPQSILFFVIWFRINFGLLSAKICLVQYILRIPFFPGLGLFCIKIHGPSLVYLYLIQFCPVLGVFLRGVNAPGFAPGHCHPPRHVTGLNLIDHSDLINLHCIFHLDMALGLHYINTFSNLGCFHCIT